MAEDTETRVADKIVESFARSRFADRAWLVGPVVCGDGTPDMLDFVVDVRGLDEREGDALMATVHGIVGGLWTADGMIATGREMSELEDAGADFGPGDADWRNGYEIARVWALEAHGAVEFYGEAGWVVAPEDEVTIGELAAVKDREGVPVAEFGALPDGAVRSNQGVTPPTRVGTPAP